MKRVINFSGGKTSALMTILEYKEGDLVIFCDTGREHPKTYKFINDFEAFENIPVIRVKNYETEDPFKTMLQKRNYKKFPNRMARICTVELKVKTCKRYLRKLGITEFENFVGFRYDEPRRVLNRKKEFARVHDKFPLYEQKITKDHVNEYWDKKPYNLEIPSILGNCDLCFLKGKSNIIAILTQMPELADKWIEDEENAAKQEGYIKGSGRQYFPDITYRQLRDIANNQMFKDYNFNELNSAYNCACTS
jgi:hypothetical protein